MSNTGDRAAATKYSHMSVFSCVHKPKHVQIHKPKHVYKPKHLHKPIHVQIHKPKHVYKPKHVHKPKHVQINKIVDKPKTLHKSMKINHVFLCT